MIFWKELVLLNGIWLLMKEKGRVRKNGIISICLFQKYKKWSCQPGFFIYSRLPVCEDKSAPLLAQICYDVAINFIPYFQNIIYNSITFVVFSNIMPKNWIHNNFWQNSTTQSALSWMLEEKLSKNCCIWLINYSVNIMVILIYQQWI